MAGAGSGDSAAASFGSAFAYSCPSALTWMPPWAMVAPTAAASCRICSAGASDRAGAGASGIRAACARAPAPQRRHEVQRREVCQRPAALDA
jgi:hypothetical protein